MATATVIYRGRERCIAELAREHRIDRRTLQSRLDRGMVIDEALRVPLRPYPDGVRRPRDPKHRPPSCDRCGKAGNLQPCGLLPWVKLCEGCQRSAATLVRRWVGCGA